MCDFFMKGDFMYNREVKINLVCLLQRLMGLDCSRKDNEFDIHLYEFGSNKYIGKTKAYFHYNKIEFDPSIVIFDYLSISQDSGLKKVTTSTECKPIFLSAKIKVKNYSNDISKVFIPKLRMEGDMSIEFCLSEKSKFYANLTILKHDGIYFECLSEDDDWFRGE